MRRILIVEDEFLIAFNLETVLQEAGFEVTGIATTFETAVSLADRTRPDLVLMDIVLGSARDGVEAAVEIRNRFGIPAVFTSANHDEGNRARAKAAAPAGWLPKPYSPERLLQTIRGVSRSGSRHGNGSAGPSGHGSGPAVSTRPEDPAFGAEPSQPTGAK